VWIAFRRMHLRLRSLLVDWSRRCSSGPFFGQTGARNNLLGPRSKKKKGLVFVWWQVSTGRIAARCLTVPLSVIGHLDGTG
jgi:hypothetical protein